MLRCVIPRACWNAFRRCPGSAECLYPRPAAFYNLSQAKRFASTEHSTHGTSSRPRRHQYDVFDRIARPSEDEQSNPVTWAALLETGLPHHLREHQQTNLRPNLTPPDIGEILLAAQRLVNPINGLDVLFHLGIEKGRWSAVVWLVKHLVEYFGSQGLHASLSSDSIFSWSSTRSLRDITQRAIDYQQYSNLLNPDPAGPTDLLSIDALTDHEATQSAGRTSTFRRQVLGQIWRSLGNMTIACADTEIKPELLEIIAYLHHMEVMPITIYSQKPPLDATAIQQPPTLGLLSSRILTSLSDAAWRARERLVVEEAKSQGEKHLSLGPELPGQSYRVNVPGLRPEIWLELILWSSLHGGWIFEGTQILQQLCSEPSERQWKPLSWRQLLPANGDGHLDWDNIQFLFNTRPPSSMDPAEDASDVPVQRTISSEIVNAYVDALLSKMYLGVGSVGMHPELILRRLNKFQEFLKRSQLSLGAGSWDAVILRFLEARAAFADHPHNFRQLVDLSPPMGADLDSYTTRDLPAYVLDGSAAIIGLFHRALRSRVKAGDVKGAFRLFSSLQAHADENKRQSVVDFLKKQQLFGEGVTQHQDDIFTSNFSGIEYPAFDMQIPPTILGPFLELVTDAKAYDLGNWLLYSDEVDGPIIPESSYADSAIAPALVRFAAETSDTQLLSKVIRIYANNKSQRGPNVPKRVLQSFFESQVSAHRSDVAVRILQHLKEQHQSHWDPSCLAHVARIMLLDSASANLGHEDSQTDLEGAKKLFVNMCEGKYENAGRDPASKGQIVTIATILSVLDPLWANLTAPIMATRRYLTFTLPAQSFNRVLEGVVDVYGSANGRHLLRLFWPHRVRQAQQAGSARLTGVKAARSVPESAEQIKSELRFGGERPSTFFMYGGLRPDLMTIRIILRKALEELNEEGSDAQREPPKPFIDPSFFEKENSNKDALEADWCAEHLHLSASGMVVWAVRRLRSLQMPDEDIHDELAAVLTEHGLERMREQLPNFFESTGHKYTIVK